MRQVRTKYRLNKKLSTQLISDLSILLYHLVPKIVHTRWNGACIKSIEIAANFIIFLLYPSNI